MQKQLGSFLFQWHINPWRELLRHIETDALRGIDWPLSYSS